MDLEDTSAATTRRRGKALEDAILEAAWQQLTSGGYQNFTYDAIAKLAQTSKPVLYRRWPTREELLAAAIGWRGAQDRLDPPDTGTLRGDVLELLRAANRRPERFLALLSAHVGGLYDSGGMTPATVRERYLGGEPGALARILTRAVERGEVAAERVTPRIASIPFDLFRIRVFMTMQALPDDDLVAIVDEVFLPLITRP